jgi:phospholipid transport system substrate-binding protein
MGPKPKTPLLQLFAYLMGRRLRLHKKKSIGGNDVTIQGEHGNKDDSAAWSCSRRPLILVLHPAARAVASGRPYRPGAGYRDKVLTIVRSSRPTSNAQMEAQRAQLIEVIYPRFDFTEMAKRSLGRHWAGRTPEEQREFVTIYAAMLGRSYADNIESYTSQNVLYRRESEDQNYAQVDTKIVTENRPPLSINYKLQSVDKEWKVYDLVIEDISVVNNYRSQFDRFIARSSFEELMRVMKEKQS